MDWQLGVGWHESESRDDAYEVLEARDAAATLMPDEQDYGWRRFGLERHVR